MISWISNISFCVFGYIVTNIVIKLVLRQFRFEIYQDMHDSLSLTRITDVLKLYHCLGFFEGKKMVFSEKKSWAFRREKKLGSSEKIKMGFSEGKNWLSEKKNRRKNAFPIKHRVFPDFFFSDETEPWISMSFWTKIIILTRISTEKFHRGTQNIDFFISS